MDHLPHETLSRIFSQQALLTRWRVLRLVCRSWNSVVTSDLGRRSLVSLDADGGCERIDISFDPYGDRLQDFVGAASRSADPRDRSLQRISFPNGLAYGTRDGDPTARLRGFIAFLAKYCVNIVSLRAGVDWRQLSAPLLQASIASLESFYCPTFVLDSSSCSLLLPQGDSHRNPLLKRLSVRRIECLPSPILSFFPSLVSLTVATDVADLDQLIPSLPLGFASLAVIGDDSLYPFIEVVAGSAARDSLRNLTVGGLEVRDAGQLARASLPSLEAASIRSISPASRDSLSALLASLSRSHHLQQLTVAQEMTHGHCNGEWIKMMHACPQLLELDVFVHEISEKVFATIGERLTQLRILRMKLTGKRIAATDAAFRSLTRLEKLEEVDLFFDQREENVSPEVMEAFVTGPSQASFRVIRVDHANEENYDYKFAEVGGFLMDMAHEHALQDGSIFGEATD